MSTINYNSASYASQALTASPLRLDRNEGPPLDAAAASLLGPIALEDARRYPSAEGLEKQLAERAGVDRRRVLVTAGGDEAIDRVCRSTIRAGDRVSLHTPTFEMIEWFTGQAGAIIEATNWRTGAFPLDRFLSTIDDRTRLVALVSPNNPTGTVIGPRDIRAVAERAASVGAVTLVDLAYIEFTAEDPTRALVDLPGVAIVRTFSKMYALAGMRVGWIAGDLDLVERARAAAGPFPTSGVSLAAASRALALPDVWTRDRAERVRCERSSLADVFRARGIAVTDSQANYVCAIMPGADAAATFARTLAYLGVLVRTWPSRPGADDLVRITCPGDSADLARLIGAVNAALDTPYV